MVRKVVMNLHLSKASGPDCIPVVVLKNRSGATRAVALDISKAFDRV